MSPVLPRCFAGFLLVAFALTGCGGKGGGGASPPAAATSTYTISGSVSGLSGIGLVLQNSGADNLPVSTTNFTFSTPVTTGGAYSVTVFTQPTGQTCSVANGSGAVGSANITTVQLSCANNPAPAPSTYTIGGTISGLTGNGLVLRNNGGDNLALSPASATSAFTFNTAIATGNPSYSVTVFIQPTGQNCNVTGGSGAVAGANVTNVQVSCVANTYTISGNVSGLADSGLVLQNNGGDNRAISANGPFTFATALASGPYSVTIFAQPGNPSQTCSVTNGSGTLAGANITNVQVNCVTNTYTISGNVSSLTGSGLVLQNNLGNNRTISANGAFTFSAAIASGSNYSVTVSTQPSGQTCSVTNGAGTAASAPITNVLVSCANNPAFTVGGSVSGLGGSGLVLQNNGSDNRAISVDGVFTFTTAIASGSSYSVTVLTHPTGQVCTVTNGSGTMANIAITNILVNCVTPTFTVGGTVTGLSGSGLVLQNNGGDNRTISVDSGFTFTTAIASGSSYSVTILSHPTGQNCTATNGSGTANANVTNVQVNCANILSYTIGGTVAGLVGSGLVLQNNGADNLNVSAGSFVFNTQIAAGAPYSVTILTQPTGQTCTVTNSSGSVAGANVTNVQLNCVTNTYTISGTVSGLTGSGLILRNNGADNRSISANGAFAFNTAIASGNPYNVTVFTQPTGQSCNVAGGSGTLAAANVTNVQVNCVVTSTYTISGNVSGPLSGTAFPSGTLELRNNGGDPISLTNYGAFTFPTAVASGLPYNVTVFQQPATNWTCVPTRATGIVGAANITDIQVSCVDNTVVSTGSMGVARNHHSATLLADGKVMVAGGWATVATAPHASAEIFDPASGANGTFAATGLMTIARTNHTATLLGSGKVLVAGGLNGGLNLNSAEVFDPAGTFSATGTTMVSARSNQAVALLDNGTVLLTGGRGGAGMPIQGAEIFDSTLSAGAGAFSTTDSMADLRMFHTATRLNTGKVLIVGGKNASFELLTAELYDPATQIFSATGAMGVIRQNHTATLLADGKVLIVGGAQNGATGNPITSAEVYDPATGLFQFTGSMAVARANHRATLLANGKVLISGGRSTSSSASALKTMEIYDPASGLFANAGSMSSPRTDHTATRLLSNRVLIAGGFDGSTAVNTADIVPQ